MVVRVRMRWPITLACVGLGGAALAWYRLTGLGLVLASLALLTVIAVQRMRLRADDSGVTVVNLLTERHIAWPEISDFRRGRTAFSACIDVCKNDGTRVRSWIVSAIGRGPYSQAMVFEVISALNGRLVVESEEAEHDVASLRVVPLAREAASG
jgi:Bacterial PH domain